MKGENQLLRVELDRIKLEHSQSVSRWNKVRGVVHAQGDTKLAKLLRKTINEIPGFPDENDVGQLESIGELGENH